MSLALIQRVKALEIRIQEMEKPVPSEDRIAYLEAKLSDLSNKYRMLNARLNKKTNNDADDRRPDTSCT